MPNLQSPCDRSDPDHACSECSDNRATCADCGERIEPDAGCYRYDGQTWCWDCAAVDAAGAAGDFDAYSNEEKMP